jgi:glycerophosphoryl diester phosphodiesterase
MTRSPNLLLLGHRGARASRHIPENTIASFELCLQHGCDGFEFDVRRSADEQAVICHDATTRGMKISETTARDIGLPLLEDVLRKFSGRAFLDIELKVARLEEQTLAALRAFPPAKGYVVSSFLPEVLRAMRALDASVPLGLLCEKREQLSSSDLRTDWVIPRADLVDRALIEKLHSGGTKVMVWTVNREEEIRKLAAAGADAIISDETEGAVRILGF